MSKPFKVGDRVAWSSQAQGHIKTKIGVIETAVPPGKSVYDFTEELKWSGRPRPEESYLVRVPGKTSKAKGKLYWPHVKSLTHCKEPR